MSRPQGTATVRVITPGPVDAGWSAAGHSVVEVVTDDMPFLVDSVTMELSRHDHNVHVVIHPRFEVTRDITGALQGVNTPADGVVEESAPEAIEESWMHVEIDRVVDEGEVSEIVESLQRVLRDVRESVEDWPKMRDRALTVVADIEDNPPPIDPTEITQGCDFIRWLADDHFTFLGYREYRLESVGEGADEEWALRAVPGTGLGILRADRDMSSSFAKLPAVVKDKAREKTLLVLAKANSRATVHRPGLPRLRRREDVRRQRRGRGERRFIGLYSSAAYTESVTRIPLLREKTATVMRTVGFDPAQPCRQGADGHAGELPARRVLPDAGRRAGADRAVRDVRPRATPAAAVRAPRHLWPLRLRARLPPSRPLQHHRPGALRGDPHRAPQRRERRVHRPRQRGHDRQRPLRRPPRQGRDDPRRRRGRPRAAHGRGRALVARRLHQRGGRGVRRGAGLAPGASPGPTPSRRPTRRTSTRAPVPPTRVGSRPSRATRALTSRCSSRSTPVVARPG
ncbi:NAD-glutamate dehydrogenase [Nocardioides sp. B-3]|nr:NAD-glutamate dehydrogenase [Nocardioides sp. B-3]UUZ61576.1 NAD-glutamate dehydrogenase [Nocardioides sp. B-3]